jgi:hypothetical protein
LRKRRHIPVVSSLIAIVLGGCGYAGTPPLPSVTVLLEPNSAVVSLGQTQQFQALVTGSADTAVMWEVNGIMNGNAISGTVSITGLYTASMAMPNPAAVTVTAVSQANPHDLASAGITLQDGIAISVLPATATVAPGGAQVFAASISGAGSVAGGVTWSVNGTPGALAQPQGQGAYDLESLLTHELGHWMGLDHSAVIRAMMFPFAPPPGQFLGNRPDGSVPDGPLADDDRTGIRAQYPDPNDTLNVGAIRGRIIPANPFALATFAAPSPGVPVTGMVGAHVVAVDSDTGSVIAGTLAGWSCDAANPPTQFDGSFDLERLPVGHIYNLYAEPLVGLELPGDFSDVFRGLCSSSVEPTCAAPPVNTNFNVRILPAVP